MNIFLRKILVCGGWLQLNVVEGKKQYLFDEKGKRYLDAFGGIATVCCGHCHPDVVEAIVNQTKRLQHSTVLYLNHAIADFAEALASKLPGNLKVCCASCHVPLISQSPSKDKQLPIKLNYAYVIHGMVIYFWVPLNLLWI